MNNEVLAFSTTKVNQTVPPMLRDLRYRLDEPADVDDLHALGKTAVADIVAGDGELAGHLSCVILAGTGGGGIDDGTDHVCCPFPIIINPFYRQNADKYHVNILARTEGVVNLKMCFSQHLNGFFMGIPSCQRTGFAV